MDADKARALQKKAQANAQAKIIADRARQTSARQKADRKYMKEEYPKFEAEIFAKIKKAATNSERGVRVTDPHNAAWEKLKEKLLDKGYTINAHHAAGEYDNMGDSAAPCNIWREPYWYYDVTW